MPLLNAKHSTTVNLIRVDQEQDVRIQEEPSNAHVLETRLVILTKRVAKLRLNVKKAMTVQKLLSVFLVMEFRNVGMSAKIINADVTLIAHLLIMLQSVSVILDTKETLAI